MRSRSELAIVGWSATTFGALLASYSAFRPVRDALALDGDPDKIPWLFTGTLVASIVATAVWSRVLANRPKRRVVPISFHVFSLCLFGFAALVYVNTDPVNVGRAFYIWSSVFNLFVVSVFWSLLADLIGPQVAKRLYGPIAAGGTVGAFAGPLLTKALVAHIGVAGVLVMSGLLLQLAVFGASRVKVAGEALDKRDIEDPVTHSDALTGARQVTRSPYLLAIVGYVLCTAIAATFLYLEQAALVKAAFSTRIARTEFFATLDLWTQGATFLVQTLLAAQLLRWLGPGLVLCLLPIAQGLGISMMALAPSLTILAIVQVTARAMTHGLTRPARELLFTVVDREDKYHAKNMIDVVGYRFGDFSTAWLHTALVSMSAGAAVLAVAAVPLSAVWIVLAVGLGVGFRRRVPPVAAADLPSARVVPKESS